MAIHTTLRVDETVDIVVLEILVACIETVVVNTDDIAYVVVIVGVVLHQLAYLGRVIIETVETICALPVHSVSFQEYFKKALWLPQRAAQ